MDKLDLCLIPFIYLFRMTLTILSTFNFIVHNPSIIGREFKNTLTWMEISGMHLILIMLSGLHRLIQFKFIQVSLNMMLRLPLSCTIIFWTKFYYSLFKHKEGRRSFWSIATNPLVSDYRTPVRQSNEITYFNMRYYCHSLYQARGDYDRLQQQSDKYLED